MQDWIVRLNLRDQSFQYFRFLGFCFSINNTPINASGETIQSEKDKMGD